jgi:glutamate racemase
MNLSADASIGVFDSGVGGLSVLRAIRRELPAEHILYVADQAHVPYGPRPLEEVRAFAEGITRFLLARGAKLIVVACNTASAAALQALRQEFPHVPFVGMEPAVKPAAEQTRSGVVGVLATPATFQGALYASVVERFAEGVKLLPHTCPGLVSQIEQGNLNGHETRSILEAALLPMLEESADTIVLGCTHYPFVMPLIQEIVGPSVRVIDPSPAIARQTRRLLEMRGLLRSAQAPASLNFFTTGPLQPFAMLLPRLLGETGLVVPLDWKDGELVERTQMKSHKEKPYAS